MTGYGKGEYENELYRFKVEIKSLNHRYNDISIKLPRHILFLEEHIKKYIKRSIFRGKIDVFIYLEYISDTGVDVKIDTPLASTYKIAIEDLAKELSLEDKITLEDILNLPDIIRTQRKDINEDEVVCCMENALRIALDEIMQMKLAEGNELKKDILDKLDKIERYLLTIENRSPYVIQKYELRLKKRISELLDSNISLDEERLNNELAYFIDRSSIDEEIVRLKSHIKQFREILNEELAIGRKIDFLIQEFNREINTIGSKANDEEISKYVVEFKTELEKIREQVQNIE